MIGTLAGMPELVALDLPGGPRFVDALRRVWDEGDAALPIDQRLPPAAARAIVDTLRPGAVIGDDGSRRHLDGGRPVEPGDALVVATSGSTGQPKGVVLTHDAVAASARSTNARLGVDPTTDTWLACLPLAHVGGLAVVTRAILSDTPLEVFSSFDAETITQAALKAAAAGRQVLISLVTAALHQVDPTLFKTILLGGATPPRHLPPQVVVTYGMTETGSGIVYDGLPLDTVGVAVDPAWPAPDGGCSEGHGGLAVHGEVLGRHARGDCGDHQCHDGGSHASSHPGPLERPAKRDHLDHADPPGPLDHPAVLGHILVRGPMLLRAYRDGRDPKRADGWLPTGDVGHLDRAGRLQVAGRMSDVIVTGGEKVWPAPVEKILADVDGVADVAVGGLPDPHWGHRVVAYVVVSDRKGPGPTLEQLREPVKAALGPWAAPRQLVQVPELPRTSNGKVRRDALATLAPAQELA